MAVRAAALSQTHLLFLTYVCVTEGGMIIYALKELREDRMR